MKTWISKHLPREQLQKLDFMVGEFSSWHTLWPAPDRPAVQYRSVLNASREGCDRFLRTEQFSDVPGIGLVSSTWLYTYDPKSDVYRAYGFSSAYEDAVQFEGTWDGDALVMLSSPVNGYCGLQRYRHTITPRGDSSWDFLEERWDLAGFILHASGTYIECPIAG